MKKRNKRFLLVLLALVVSNIMLLAQVKRTITGVVTDSDGKPVPSATVSVKGSSQSAITDENGRYTITVDKNNPVLVFSSVGFGTKELSAGSATSLNAKIEATAGDLGEVVVTSLGITKKQRAIGYAATTIKAEDLVQSGTPNVATALYGKAPGVRIAATPGGATSGVSLQVRGVNSINFNSQPLIIMDGVPVRNGSFDNGNYWGDQRVRGNGILDFNPEDVESITILKGASAAALYGSEAMNGVMVITTKSGKGRKGFNVDLNANYSQDQVAYLPRWQKKRGAGFPVGYKLYGDAVSNNGGFESRTVNGTTYRALPQTSLSFGPEFDGQPILSWDGEVRPYSYQEDGFANLFQKANNSTVNLAVTNSTDKSNSRFSYTFQHTEGLSLNSKNDKHNFSFNNNYKFGDKVNTNIIINYMNWHIHNRPFMIDRMINNFSGMFPSFDNGDWYKARYKTSLGYKYVTGSNQSLTPDENILYPNFRGEIAEFLWNVLENNNEEYVNRVNAVVKADWQIVKGLNLQGRLSTDYTTTRIMNKSNATVPLAFNYSGGFSMSHATNKWIYGDALLTYNKKITSDLQATAMAGYNARSQEDFSNSTWTNGGLTTENKFDMVFSRDALGTGASQRYFLIDGLFGTLNLDYKNYLFAEATVRRDRTSTMPADNNTFTYPSVNAGFIFSDAFQLPKFIDYGKLRASWGIVGSYPEMYVANPAYNVGNLGNQGNGSVLTNTIRNNPYGNSNIKPEMKHEYEFGLEARFLQNRLGLDVSYYKARIVDQILNLSLPISSGGGSILTNIGTLENKGVELALRGTPVQTRLFNWELGVNFAVNKNKVVKLTDGATELLHANHDGDALKRASVVGQPMGDWFAHPILTNDKGEKVVAEDGTYKLDGSQWVKYGNSMPKGAGGIWNSLRYSNFNLDFTLDFTYGGYVAPMGLYWLTGRGLTEESLKTPEYATSSGLKYYVDDNGVGHGTTAAQGPNGEIVMNDGILLEGVKADGSPNNIVISPAYYYWLSYNWGGPQYGSSLYFKYVNKNNYLKMRELSLSYTLPGKLAAKLKANKLQFSVFGRNLFYLYRSIKDMDAEQLTTGTSWGSNLGNAGTNPSSRSFGVMLRATF
ncbi:SusC/RagA family TonB-linked outer membrane protein [Terrimonas pollutisoli]|uniref:SusC/RagA family TonB-linked outer membrane protein n=1 Tax=Terrimonas pollutisoli TaxID=3034147 RepID=UPI0023ED6FE8|nr:SusC/RagA family TonB-linked outer membrane protein [Terrimonas sp. H1YJ31]